MKLPKDTMLDLMAYADGELDEADKKRVEALLASSEDARRVVEGMAGIGAIVGRIYEAPAASLSDGIVDHVMDRVERARAQGDKADEPRKPSVRPAKILDLRAEREKRLKLGAAVVAIVALAAGIVLTTRHANEQAPVAKGTPQDVAPPPKGTAPPPTAPVAPHDEVAAAAGVDVEQVDSNRDVQVYYLPSSVRANASSVVVWIDDKGAAP